MSDLKEAVQAAILAHGMWKSHLAMAIGSGQSKFAVAEAKKEDACQFGKWLLGDAALKKSPHFANIRTLHASFHQEAAKVLAMALEGKKEEARTAMGRDSAFETTSATLTKALLAWKKEA
jgi:hypothetical protein